MSKGVIMQQNLISKCEMDFGQRCEISRPQSVLFWFLGACFFAGFLGAICLQCKWLSVNLFYRLTLLVPRFLCQFINNFHLIIICCKQILSMFLFQIFISTKSLQ